MPITCFNLRDVVSCQYTDLAFLLAVLVNFVYLLLINSYYTATKSANQAYNVSV